MNREEISNSIQKIQESIDSRGKKNKARLKTINEITGTRILLFTLIVIVGLSVIKDPVILNVSCLCVSSFVFGFLDSLKRKIKLTIVYSKLCNQYDEIFKEALLAKIPDDEINKVIN